MDSNQVLNIKGKNIWIFADIDTRWIWLSVFTYLEENGYYPILFVKDNLELKYFSEQTTSAFNGKIIILPDLYSDIVNCNFSEVEIDSALLRESSQIEETYNLSIFRDLALSDRHFGSPFVISGERHPLSNISNSVNHFSTLKSARSMFKFYDHIFQNYPPSLLLTYGGASGIYRAPAAYIVKKANAPERYIFSGRVSGYMYWGEDNYQTSQWFVNAYKEQDAVSYEDAIKIISKIRPNVLASKQMRSEFEDKLLIYNIVKEMLLFYARKAYQKIRRRPRGVRGYKGFSVLLSLLRARRDLGKLNRLDYDILDIPDIYKKVFFPLQQDPEASTYVYSRFTTNQYEIIKEISLSLPANSVLLVKEHLWALGRREKNLYKRIRNLPNVYMLKIGIKPQDIINEIDLVCTITSSFAHEAAILGKPVVIFDENTPLNVLPHVTCIKSTRELVVIKDLLRSFNNKEKMVCDGAQYLNAIENNMVSFKDQKFIKDAQPNSDFIRELINSLAKTLP